MSDLVKKGDTQTAQFSPGENLIGDGAMVQQVRTVHVTSVSVAKPRPSLQEIERRAIEEGRYDSEKMLYSWTTKNKDGSTGLVEGPTVEMAMLLARIYGNCSVLCALLSETKTHWYFDAVFVDRETGFEHKVLLPHSKPVVANRGKMDLERIFQSEFLVGQAKAKRKVVIDAMNRGLVRRLMGIAKAAIGKKAVERSGGLKKTIDKIIPYFEQQNVDLAMLETKIGKKASEWTFNDIGTIKALAKSIKDGITTIEDEFFKEAGSATSHMMDDDFDPGDVDEVAEIITADGEVIAVKPAPQDEIQPPK